jgi:ADP-ribose pyrophosphatase YjhB (NUDIX family)
MIRPQALALIRRGDRILVEQGRDEVEDETFFRLLGGTIEFGEKGADTVRRELLEELQAEIEVGDLVATIENVFTYEGVPAHEIALVYESSFRDERFYELDAWDSAETAPSGTLLVHKIAWKATDSFGSGGESLYPEELLPLLRGG